MAKRLGETIKDDIILLEGDQNILVQSDTNNISQGLTGTYQVLTNMSLTLGVGTYEIDCSGFIITASNDVAQVALFEDGVEIGGTDGHTQRQVGGTDLVVTPNVRGSFHTMASVVVSTGTKTITCQGLETVGTNCTFEKGRIRALKVNS